MQVQSTNSPHPDGSTDFKCITGAYVPLRTKNTSILSRDAHLRRRRRPRKLYSFTITAMANYASIMQVLVVATMLLRTFADTGTAWQVNHTSQVKSIAVVPNSDIVLTGSQFTDDQSVTSLDAQTGKVFWSSDILASWTYGVSVHEDGVAAFGCQFDTGRSSVSPCRLGLWKHATDQQLSWTLPLPGAELSANMGPPFVDFSPDGRYVMVTFVDRNSTAHPGAEFLAVISTSDPTKKPERAFLGSGQGHGLHVANTTLQPTWALISRPPTAPAPPAPPAPPWVPATDCAPSCGSGAACCKNPVSGQADGICLGVANCSQVPHLQQRFAHDQLLMGARPLSQPIVSGSFVSHFGVQIGGDKPIDIASTSSIDCNGTAECTWLGASPDLSVVLVNAAATGPGSACALQRMDPNRWGIALLRRNGTAWPPVYDTMWTQCSDKANVKVLTSVHLTPDRSRVLATFAHVTPGTTNVVAAEACAFHADGGDQLWCTPPHPTVGGSIVPTVSALTVDGQQLVWHHATEGLLLVHAMAMVSPKIIVLSSGGKNDCCAATALAVVGGTAIVSIPDGTVNPPWCHCEHSRLLGVKLPAVSG